MIAVDVVLLPPEHVMDKAIEFNRELLKKFENKIVLNKKNCLPHISLAMGAIEERDLESVGKILKKLGKLLPLELGIYGIETVGGSPCFSIKSSQEIQELHETIMNGLKKYFTYKVERDMFFNPSEVSISSINYVKDYPIKYSFKNFYPHITLGEEKLEKDVSIKFTASRLAVCQLGSSCTCRKILFDFNV